jgi:NAD(P)H-hydrate epimerase
MRLLNAAQMREADRRAIQDLGIPSLVLMENAGRQVVDAMAASLGGAADHRVAVLCGRGNNGGDGFVAARVLHDRGADVVVCLLGAVGEVKGDARVNLDILRRLGIAVREITDESGWAALAPFLGASDAIVDALFGTGLSSALTGLAALVIAGVNDMKVPVVSVDLPSGLSADAHDLIGPCVEATLTVTFAAPKLPLVLLPGAQHAGEVVVADIGIPREVIDVLDGPWVEVSAREELGPLVQPRAEASHKGDFGHVLVVAGSRGKTGAAHLAAAGALRSGAGLVTVATPRSCQPVVAALGAEYMTEDLDETLEGSIAAAAAVRVLDLPADVVAVGPGLGTVAETRAFVRALLSQEKRPLVVDADALNAFAGDAAALVAREGLDVIVTPHPGEMARLVGKTTEEIQADRVGAARSLATANRLYVVLKGHQTVVVTPAGKAFVNPTGNPGMATGGAGDVLTGMIAAWLGQLHDAEAATRLAVYLHGSAGDLAAAERGQHALTAADIVSRLSDAVQELGATMEGE